LGPHRLRALTILCPPHSKIQGTFRKRHNASRRWTRLCGRSGAHRAGMRARCRHDVGESPPGGATRGPGVVADGVVYLCGSGTRSVVMRPRGPSPGSVRRKGQGFCKPLASAMGSMTPRTCVAPLCGVQRRTLWSGWSGLTAHVTSSTCTILPVATATLSLEIRRRRPRVGCGHLVGGERAAVQLRAAVRPRRRQWRDYSRHALGAGSARSARPEPSGGHNLPAQPLTYSSGRPWL